MRVILVSECCHGAASHRFQHPRLLRNNKKKGDLRKRKILPWQLWCYIFVFRHISHRRVCHIFIYVFVCFVIHFLIPFGPYFILCLLTICNWGGS
jgi:hypothetical protein